VSRFWISIGITRSFCEHGYEHSIFFSEARNFLSSWGGNRQLIDGTDPLEFQLTKTPAILQLGCTPEIAVGEVAAQSRRSFQVMSVTTVHAGHEHVHSVSTLILSSNLTLGSSSGLHFQCFQSKMYKQFSSQHVPHVLLFGVIISCSKYKLWTPSHYVTLLLTVSLPPINSNSKSQSPLKRNFHWLKKNPTLHRKFSNNFFL